MVSSLDRHFPWGCDRGTSLPPGKLRPRFREFAQEVDEQVIVNSDGRDILEWKVTITILRVLVKKIKRLSRNGAENCLNAFGPHSDSFVWAVYKNNAAVRESVNTWCHHLGWRHVYTVLIDNSSPQPEKSCDGIQLIGLRPNSVLNRLREENPIIQSRHARSGSVPVNAAYGQEYTTYNCERKDRGN